ncbi:MAG: aspartate--tRNA ligase [Oscillospiraceae bacterium]|jgi:aspartyl-tRNA synthetase|nr:aspartate--tRNA ligase [Oscillospiraceae bacterium]
MLRTHTCGQLRADDAGRTVTLTGWLDNVRDLGAMLFFVVRDTYGITQAVASDADIMNAVREIPIESAVRVSGEAILRSSPNNKIPTGEIEIRPRSVDDIEVLGKCVEELPFQIDDSRSSREDLRLKYRFLDLRNPLNQSRIKLRSSVIASIRKHMTAQGFLEVQTPILTNSSPEGARDYIVPSRVHAGRFYALPQAPQQYKQLLMASGFDRYFQIAPCFRDEDARADRSPGEFYQLDMEMAFAGQEDVFAAIEPVMYSVFTEHTSKRVTPAPFPRIAYRDAIAQFGSDKPDLRNPLRIADVSDMVDDTYPGFFQEKEVRAIKIDKFTLTRKQMDAIAAKVKEMGGANAYWFKWDNGAAAGGAANALGQDNAGKLASALGIPNGGAAVMLAEPKETAAKLSGMLRGLLGDALGIIDEDQFAFCWVVDFPMFERDEETGGIIFSHNPFSMPQGGLDALKGGDPLNVLAYQYDIVCNGIELSSGAVRNHDPATMVRAFQLAGYGEEEVSKRFPALYNAFRYGAPPHAGVAPGVDRIVMLLSGEPNIREVIAFPMNKNAQEPLMGSPGVVTDKQLRDVHIRVAE